MKKRDILIAAGIIIIALVVLLVSRQIKGYMVIKTPGVELRLKACPFGGVTVRSELSPVEVPARIYLPTALTLTGTQNGESWQLQGQSPWGELGRIKVQKGQTTTLKPGPPLLIKTNVTTSGRQVSVGLSIIGQAGENYRPVVMKNGQRASAPKARILDENGNVLASCNFAFG